MITAVQYFSVAPIIWHAVGRVVLVVVQVLHKFVQHICHLYLFGCLLDSLLINYLKTCMCDLCIIVSHIGCELGTVCRSNKSNPALPFILMYSANMSSVRIK